MVISPVIFRGYDIRGVVRTELTAEVYAALGRGYSAFLRKRGIFDMVLAQDVRESSPELTEAFLGSLLSMGINVWDIGVVPTQMAYFAQYLFLTKGSAVVTASHLPLKYNGLKLSSGFSETLLTPEIEEIKELSQTIVENNSTLHGTCIKKDIFEEYKNDLLKRVRFNGRKLKVVVDSGGGTTGPYLPKIIREFGCEVVEQNTSVDPKLSLGTPDPTEESMQKRLATSVVANNADLGLAYDCDGDRMGVVDEKGSIIWNDSLVALFAKGVLERMPHAPIVYNALCSKVVKDTISSSGGNPVMWITGHSFIKQKVRELRSPFGGELSGHFFFMDNYFGHDDGAISSLRLLDIVGRSGLSLSELVGSLPHYVTSPEIKLGYPDESKKEFVAKKCRDFLSTLLIGSEVNDIDGIRFENESAMAIIRPSQNGPYITIKFESRDESEYNEIKNKLNTFLKGEVNVNWDEGSNTDSLS